jgi:plastocyanin
MKSDGEVSAMSATIIAVVVVFAIGLGYLAMKPGVVSPQVTGAGAVPATQAPAQETPSREVTVVGTEFAYEPKVLYLKPGETVKVTFVNNGKYPHNLVSPDLGINSGAPAPAGKSSTFLLTIPAGTNPGNYSFWCSVPTHKDRGMVGTITVG